MTFLYTVANNGSDYERNLCESKDMFLSSPLPVALRWWNEQGESVSQSLARLNKKDSWLFWWTLFLNVHAAAWVIIGIFSVKRFEADYVLVVAVCASLGIANIVGFTKCRKDAKKQIQGFASQALASHFTSSIRSALGAV
ncbi:Golgi apparatus membrane protein-like protein ECHIDNA isoform X2 [Populus trichocarpa]|uniref:Golgi apparatus membrane protein TVP23 n=1 Tax=Populus trichocarpa TaxID=3694 RepID=A0A3N7FYL1_POPTR|nr:Golgi apparatus membrane protein-like protein ECHIDNA isoform X2 [Populus trichocarpa]